MIFNFNVSRETEAQVPLTIELLGVEHRQENVVRPLGFHLFQWFYCKEGSGEVIIQGEKTILSEGQGILIYPEVPHSYKARDGGWKVNFIGFEGGNARGILNTLHMSESGVYHVLTPELFENTLYKCLELYEDKKKDHLKELSVICYEFLLGLSDAVRYITPSYLETDHRVVKEIIAYIEEHYMDTISIGDLAELVNLSGAYMQTVFKKEVGHTVGKHIELVRISNARNMLVSYPDKTVNEIAAMCGFLSPSYFGKVFKQVTGKSPGEYRK